MAWWSAVGVNVDRSREGGSECDDVLLGELVARVCEMGDGLFVNKGSVWWCESVRDGIDCVRG